jgi:hypothetical protein
VPAGDAAAEAGGITAMVLQYPTAFLFIAVNRGACSTSLLIALPHLSDG